MSATKDTDEKIVAVLHDVIEDHNKFSKQVFNILPAPLWDALLCVTKREGEEYEDFIERCASNKIARAVKLLDLYDNIDLTRLTEIGDWEIKRTLKYHKAIMRLKQ